MVKNPLIPMGAVTGRPDRARMEHVLKAYKSVGIEQFLIYPRSGLEYEYMSEEWMAFCKNTVEIAAELDMDIWLYDEYNWPSGNCRGQVTQGHEEFYPNALVFEKKNGRWESRIVRNHIGADILNPDAVARFLQLTHQRYYDELSRYFGTVIKGIFTDEPSFGYFTSNSDGTFSGLTNGAMLAWYDGLETDYAAVRGGDLRRDMALHLDGCTPDHLWQDYYRLMGDRMRTVYVGGMNEWCEQHGIVLTGHLMCEHAPTSVRYNGDPLKMLSVFSQPGMDEITTHVSFDDPGTMELSALSLVQYAGRRREHQLAELFALGPTEMNMATMRQMIWMTACYGVDRYVLAVAALDPKGNAEKDSYYFPTSEAQPWFEFYPELGESARLAAETARKAYEPTVHLRYPSTLFMRVFGTERGKRIGEMYVALLNELVKGQTQYLYLDEEETASGAVIALDENGLYIEGETARFDDAEAFVRHVNERCPRRCIVCDEQGKETRDVLTRVWADGTVTLVDLTRRDDGDRLLTVSVDGLVGHVRLAGHGVFCGKREDMTAKQPDFLCEAPLKNIALSLEQSNLQRCLYTKADPFITLNVSENIEGLRFHVRKDPCEVTVLLDGQPVCADKRDDRLPDGFSPLYGMSGAFTLSAGEHILAITNADDAPDYRFLPGLFMSGDFEADEHGLLRRFSGCGGLGTLPALKDYTGSFTLESAVFVPGIGGLILSLDTRGACVRVSLDDEDLGAACWGPFEWKVPEKFKGGLHTLRVRITTSVMPMMGDLKCLEKEQPYASWVAIRSGEAAHPGLMKMPVWKTE